MVGRTAITPRRSRAVLEVPVPGGRIAVTERGSGVPILFLHGGTGTGELDWGAAADHLSRRGYRTIVPDLRGHGVSLNQEPELGVVRFGLDSTHVLRALGVPRAVHVGFSVGGIASQLRGMVEGIVPTKLRDGDREHDIRVRLAPEFRNDPAAILRTPLYSPTGAAVRAGEVAEFTPAVGPSNIDREQRRRQAKVGVDLAAGFALGDVTADVQRAVETAAPPPSLDRTFGGGDGWVTNRTSFGDRAETMLVQPDGKSWSVESAETSLPAS